MLKRNAPRSQVGLHKMSALALSPRAVAAAAGVAYALRRSAPSPAARASPYGPARNFFWGRWASLKPSRFPLHHEVFSTRGGLGPSGAPMFLRNIVVTQVKPSSRPTLCQVFRATFHRSRSAITRLARSSTVNQGSFTSPCFASTDFVLTSYIKAEGFASITRL